MSADDIIKGYKVDTDTYIEVTKDELDDIALDSTRTIEIDEFVPRRRDRQPLSDPPLLSRARRQGRPRRLRGDPRDHPQHGQGRDRPRGADQPRAHHRARAARQRSDGHAAALPYEVRSEKEYFDDIQDVKITKDMLDLAKHIVEQKSAEFDPEEFEDRYEQALIDLINQKRNGLQIGQGRRRRPAATSST